MRSLQSWANPLRPCEHRNVLVAYPACSITIGSRTCCYFEENVGSSLFKCFFWPLVFHLLSPLSPWLRSFHNFWLWCLTPRPCEPRKGHNRASEEQHIPIFSPFSSEEVFKPFLVEHILGLMSSILWHLPSVFVVPLMTFRSLSVLCFDSLSAVFCWMKSMMSNTYHLFDSHEITSVLSQRLTPLRTTKYLSRPSSMLYYNRTKLQTCCSFRWSAPGERWFEFVTMLLLTGISSSFLATFPVTMVFHIV